MEILFYFNRNFIPFRGVSIFLSRMYKRGKFILNIARENKYIYAFAPIISSHLLSLLSSFHIDTHKSLEYYTVRVVLCRIVLLCILYNLICFVFLFIFVTFVYFYFFFRFFPILAMEKEKASNKKFVSAVKRFPALYAPAHPDYRKAYKRFEMWENVAKESNLPSSMLYYTYKTQGWLLSKTGTKWSLRGSFNYCRMTPFVLMFGGGCLHIKLKILKMSIQIPHFCRLFDSSYLIYLHYKFSLVLC